jgi:hypothetical protein
MLAILIIKIGFLKARQRRAFKKILVFPAPKGLETPNIGFIMGIAGYLGNSKEKMIPIKPKNNVAG